MKSSTTLAALVAHCRALTRHQQTSDAELLRRFVGQRDAAAFEELLKRHAPLVWGVCRRILSCEADCEDAFQAVFLALFRQAGSVDPQRPLGAWLHGVAVRTARKAEARSARQRTNTTVPERATSGDVADELGRRELFLVVDEEVARLPVLLRMPFILCCLEGRTRDEAAAALGCSVAAIKSRLERARSLLRRNLERRGMQLPAAFLILGLTVAHVHASLRAKAIQSVFGSAPPMVAALVSAAGVSLASKLTLTATSLVMVGVLGFGSFAIMEAELPKEAPTQKPYSSSKYHQPSSDEKVRPRLDRFGDPLPPGAIRRFGTLRFRHNGIYHLAFTPDSKQLIAGWGAYPLAVFDSITGRKLRDVGKRSPNNPAGFAISPDGRWLATCGTDVLLWDLQTGRLERELHCSRCKSVAFSPDGKVVAAASEFRAEVTLVEVATGKRLEKWTVQEGPSLRFDFRSLAFSPDGKYLAGLLRELRETPSLVYRVVSSQVCLFDAKKGTRLRTFESADAPIDDFGFQPGAGRLVSITKDILRFWDVETGKEVRYFSVTNGKKTNKDVYGTISLRFSADGHRCAVVNGNAGLLLVLDARNGRELRRIDIGKTIAFGTIAFSPDGRTTAWALFRESRVRVWDVDSGIERLADAGHSVPAILSLSADGRMLISRDEQEQTFHWDVRTGVGPRKQNAAEEKTVVPLRRIWNTTVRCPRWQYLIDSETMTLQVRSLNGSRLLRKAKVPTMDRTFALSLDGTHLAVAFQDARRSVWLWNPEKEETPRTLTGHPDACQELLFSHDGKRLIAGAGTHNAYSSSTVWIWDVTTARLIRKLATYSAPGCLLLSADDRLLITGGLSHDTSVHVWDMETGKELALVTDPPSKEPGSIHGLALSADERFLAIVFNRGDASTVSIWETGSWKVIRAFAPTHPSNYARSMVFSGDGRSLFVANSDSTILQWDVSGQFGKKTEMPNRDRLNNLWRTLTETPDKAYPAVWEMLDHPAESVPFLSGKVSPIKPLEEKRVRQLLGRLDAETFAKREEASRQLLALGERALPLLRQALKDKPSLEMKKRVEGVIESLTSAPSAEQLRLLRALAVLEWSGLAEADEHLRRLAGGAPSASLTQAAKAARQRRLSEPRP